VVRLVSSDYDLRKKYDFGGIEIERDYDPRLGEVYCDRIEIEQVFSTWSRTRPRPWRAGASRHLTGIALRTREEGNGVRVEIEDNGPGMDEETCKRVFEPFFTTKPWGLGTGSACRCLTSSSPSTMASSISVSSDAGTGTCFTIRLPQRGRAGMSPRSLLVDDESAGRGASVKAFSRTRHGGGRRGSAEEALAGSGMGPSVRLDGLHHGPCVSPAWTATWPSIPCTGCSPRCGSLIHIRPSRPAMPSRTSSAPWASAEPQLLRKPLADMELLADAVRAVARR